MIIISEGLDKQRQISACGCGSGACSKINDQLLILAKERFGHKDVNQRKWNLKSYILWKSFWIWCETNIYYALSFSCCEAHRYCEMNSFNKWTYLTNWCQFSMRLSCYWL